MAAVWRLEDDCLAPAAKLRVDYAGPDPFKVCQASIEIVRKIFEVEKKDVWEREFRWDISEDPRPFYMRVVVDKGWDARSSSLIEVIFQGVQPSDPAKNGSVTIFIRGTLRTNYVLDTAFKRLPIYSGVTKLGGLAEFGGLLWIYHRIFYNEVRRGYLKMCNRKLEELWRTLRETLKVPVP